jgi:hypothetical protein
MIKSVFCIIPHVFPRSLRQAYHLRDSSVVGIRVKSEARVGIE